MTDLSIKVLDEIHKQFQLDDKWLSRSANNMSWVAHRLEQTITVTEPFESNGLEVVLVCPGLMFRAEFDWG